MEISQGRLTELLALEKRVADGITEAEIKATDSLGRYKFQMFGYWAAIWVHLNRIAGPTVKSYQNPFTDFVKLVRSRAPKREIDLESFARKGTADSAG